MTKKMEHEFVPVPKDLKRYVIGKSGSVVKEVQRLSGATVFSPHRDTEGFTVSGSKEQRAYAKSLISAKVEGGRINEKEKEDKRLCYYIDEWNLHGNCKLKLERVVQDESQEHHYRLKPAKVYAPQGAGSPNCDTSYLEKLKVDVLETLCKIKNEMKAKTYLKADMWCHFGTVLIQRPTEGTEGEWDIKEAVDKLQPSREGSHWRARFMGGVNVDEKLIEEHILDKTPEEYDEYSSRYDLTFVMPSGRQLSLKVWVTKEGKKAEDIPTPSSDVKNILQKLHFKDEKTRSRCHGWLILPPWQYLRADILFPGCEFDCRLTIRGRTENALHTDYAPEEDTIKVLSEYLSELTFADDDFGLCLPKRDLPRGFHLSYKRCSKRTKYGFTSEFYIILSKESSYVKQAMTEEARLSTDFHLHCKEWDELLDSRNWEPETIVKKLPEFFDFVKKIQRCVIDQMDENVPPEILSRGPAALEAYNKALAGGKTSVKRVPIMLIGQDRAGKTSLKKSLRGLGFDPKEGSTVGIDVDPSYFKVTNEMWRTGTTGKDQNPDAAISFDRHAAMWVVDQLKKESEAGLLEDSTKEIKHPSDSEVTEIPQQPGPTELPKDALPIQSPSEARVTFSENAHQVLLRPSNQNLEDSDGFAPCVPEVVAVETETLLRGSWEDCKEDVYSTLWDFSGQSVYYVTHPLFLTARAIFCLVYDLSLNPDDVAPPLVRQGVYEPFREEFNLKTNMDYLDFWMRSAASVASLDQNRDLSPKSEGPTKNRPAVFLVCTHADTPYENCNPRGLAYKILGRLRQKPYSSHLVDVFFVDNTKSGSESECQEVVRLRQKVLALAKTLPHTKETIPIRWLKFDKSLRALKEKGDNYISMELANVIASKDCNIVEDKELKTLMNYLHDLRSLIHFDDSPKLSKIVVLNPQWLIDVFKKVITVQPVYECEEEKFLQLWGKLEKEGILDEKLLRHMWEPLLENSDTCDSLVEIMEKFSLLCRWPSSTPENKSYLVPSMLRSHPPKEIFKLLQSARISSLFLKFESGHVPPGFFPRLVLKFFQCDELWKQTESKLYHNFARFFTSDDETCSVILLCHSSSVEIVVHKPNRTLTLAGDHSSARALSTDFQCDTTVATEVTCAGAVLRRLGLMIECMRNEFSWLTEMKYEMCVLCPVCCHKGAAKYCHTHSRERCKEEHCLHFFSISELCRNKEDTFCYRFAAAEDTQVPVMHFSHWFDPSGHQLAIGDGDKRQSPSGAGNEEKAIALPDLVRKSLLSQSCDSTKIVSQLKESLRLSQASLESPDAETKKWIRCLAKEANIAGRSDVVKSLRNISPAGTTGPLLPEKLDVREIPFKKARQLTISLTVAAGETWKLIAEKLGFSPLEIRFLDERTKNPAEAALSYVAHQRCFTLGDLYDVLADCGLPLIADEL